MERKYPWTRYVYPLGHWFESEPRAGVRRLAVVRPGTLPDGVWQLRDLRDVPALAVLGERGAGKSDVLTVEHALLEGEGAHVYPVIDISACFSVGGFASALDAATVWVRGLPRGAAGEKITAHVLVDGLDDLVVRPEFAARALAAGVKDLRSIDGVDVRLIVACRTPLWPLYDEKLASLAGEVVTAADVAPLTDEDIALAATVEQLDPDALLAELDARGLMPLARYPAMLIAVLLARATVSPIPLSVVEIYERALYGQCAADPAALRAGDAAPADVALDAASVIAGYERLSGHTGISLKQTLTATPHGDVLSAGKLVAAAPPNAGNVVLSWPLVQQVASSGVYRDQGGQLYRPRHGSYTDFLAARFLHKLSDLPTARMLDLLLGPQIAGRRRVWPPLAEVAGHLASLNKEVRAALLAQDPQALLHCDLPSWPGDERRGLVDALLAAASLLDDYAADAPLFARVAYPGLDGQLRAVIEQRGGGAALDLALELAASCRPAGLAPTLVDLAADAAADLDARRRAVATLPRPLAAPDAKRLLDLARTTHASSAEDRDLCFAALDALWPETITAADLLPLLPTAGSTPAQQRVLLHTVPIASRDEQLPDLLEWAATAAASGDNEVRRGAVILLSRAVRLDPVDGRLPERLAQVVMDNGFWHQDEWKQLDGVLKGAGSLRRAVVAALVAAAPGRVAGLLGLWPGLRDPGDTSWLIQQVDATSGVQQAAWIDVLLAVADMADPATAAQVAQAETRVPALGERRAAAAAVGARAPSSTQLPSAAPCTGADLSELLFETLDAQSGSPGLAWPEVLRILTEARLEPVTVQLPLTGSVVPPFGWTVHSRALQRVDPPVAERVIDCAADFLAGVDPGTVSIDPVTPTGTSITARYKLSEAAHAGRSAFELLAELPTARLGLLSAAGWALWAGPLLHLQSNGAPQQNAHSALVARAYKADRTGFVDTAVTQLRHQHTFHAEPEAFFALAGCWKLGDLAEQLAARATGLAGEQVLTETVLRGLMTHSGGTAPYEAAAAHLGDVDATGEPTPAAVACAMALLSGYEYPLAPVSPVWDGLLRSPALLRRVLHTASGLDRHGWDDALASAPTDSLPELYRKASDLFPPHNDPPPSPTDWADQGHRIAELRDRILHEIAYRADAAAVAFLQDLARSESRSSVFAPLLRIANTAAVGGWEPISVEHLGDLVRDPRRRIVHDSAGLLALVQEALDDFQTDLQGSRALAHLLWNETKTIRHPKPEVSLSDLTAWFLDLHLGAHRVVINREVQIRRLTPAGLAESVDIAVEAPAERLDGTRAVVIIEVKGGWNPDLEVSLQTQLHDRYLAADPDAAGLYLVGFYLCPVWAPAEGRLTEHRRHPDIEDLRRLLAQQATLLARTPAVRVLDVAFPPAKAAKKPTQAKKPAKKASPALPKSPSRP